jgi:hypothetical protein
VLETTPIPIEPRLSCHSDHFPEIGGVSRSRDHSRMLTGTQRIQESARTPNHATKMFKLEGTPMQSKTRFFAISSVLFLLTAAFAPASAHAWPLGKLLHLHPGTEQDKDARITIQLYNKTDLPAEVKIADRVHIIDPHCGLLVKAPEGTEVFSARTTFHHRDGDLLFQVTEKLNGSTISID